MAEINDAQVEGTYVQQMFDSIAERYDLGNTFLSFGSHFLWRRIFINLLPDKEKGMALDLCTGTGDLLLPLRTKYEKVIGADFSWKMLLAGKLSEKFKEIGEDCLVQADALALPFESDSFDVVTVAFGVRNFSDRVQGLKEIKRVLKPGGSIAIMEFGQPWLPGFSWMFRFYSKWIMPILGGLLTGNRKAYEYLPSTSLKFPCGKEFAQVLEGLGFKIKKVRSLTFGIAYIYLAEV